jgi:hypothetical protein
MHLTSLNTSIICPLNDAESLTIIKIAKKKGYEVRISLQNGGFCPLFREPVSTFRGLKENVIIIEMPGIEKESEIKAKHNLIIIDHHDYSSLNVMRDNPISSLEQFSKLLNYKLSNFENAIAINDQKYIYGMIESHLPIETIKEIRNLDLSFKGYSEEEIEISKKDLQSKITTPNGIHHYKATIIDKHTYLSDLHIFSQNGKISNFSITGPASKGKEKYLWFSGDMEIIRKLKKLGGYSKQSNEQYGYWGGFQKGIEKVDLYLAHKILESE